MTVTNGSMANVESSDIASNTAGSSGGGLWCDGSSATITNSTVTSNTASGNGGGMRSANATVSLVNDTIAYNMAGTAGDGIRSVGTSATVINSILWGNNGDDLNGPFDTSFTNVEEGGPAGSGQHLLEPELRLGCHRRLPSELRLALDRYGKRRVRTSVRQGRLDASSRRHQRRQSLISDMGAYEYAAASPHSTLEPDDTWMNASVTVTITASDDTSIAATYYRENAGAVTTYTAPFLVSAAGTTTIDFWSVDDVGNIEPTQTADIRIDLVDPVTIDDSPPGWVNYDVDLALMATDDMSGVALTEWWTDTAPMPEAYMDPIEISVEGTRNVYYRSTDVAGNVEVTRTATVGIDKTDPWSWDDTPMDWQSAPFDVTIKATDTVSGMAAIDVTVTAPSFGVTTSTAMSELTTVTVSEDGTTTDRVHRLRQGGQLRWAVDDVGLSRYDEPTVSVTVDPASWSSTPVTVSIEATDTLSGMDEILYWVDGFGPIIYQGPFQITAEGTTYDRCSGLRCGRQRRPRQLLRCHDRLHRAGDEQTMRQAGWQSTDVTVTIDYD